MRIESLWAEQVFIVRVVGDRRPSAVHRIVGSLLFSALADLLIRHSGLRAGAIAAGGTYAVYNVCDVQFGVSEMHVGKDTITFKRSLGVLKRSRTFPRSEVEKLGYLRGSNKEYPALGMMVRSLIMPFHFAKGISYEEAKDVFAAISASNTWLSAKTLDIDRPLF
jgi:hypothetical protein